MIFKIPNVLIAVPGLQASNYKAVSTGSALDRVARGRLDRAESDVVPEVLQHCPIR